MGDIRGLGIQDLFTTADLSAVSAATGLRMFASSIIHTTHIKVGEAGTEILNTSAGKFSTRL